MTAQKNKSFFFYSRNFYPVIRHPIPFRPLFYLFVISCVLKGVIGVQLGVKSFQLWSVFQILRTSRQSETSSTHTHQSGSWQLYRLRKNEWIPHHVLYMKVHLMIRDDMRWFKTLWCVIIMLACIWESYLYLVVNFTSIRGLCFCVLCVWLQLYFSDICLFVRACGSELLKNVSNNLFFSHFWISDMFFSLKNFSSAKLFYKKLSVRGKPKSFLIFSANKSNLFDHSKRVWWKYFEENEPWKNVKKDVCVRARVCVFSVRRSHFFIRNLV